MGLKRRDLKCGLSRKPTNSNQTVSLSSFSEQGNDLVYGGPSFATPLRTPYVGKRRHVLFDRLRTCRPICSNSDVEHRHHSGTRVAVLACDQLAPIDEGLLRMLRVQIYFVSIGIMLGMQCLTFGGQLGGLDVSGDVKDFRHAMSTSGVKLQIDFSKIAYDGRIKAISVRAAESDSTPSAHERQRKQAGNQYEVRMELDAIRFTIGKTQIKSWLPIGAECGPMKIRLGTKRNLIVTFLVERSGASINVHETKLKLEEDNWTIGTPEHVRTSGFGMTKQRVVKGLYQGLRDKAEFIAEIMIQETQEIIDKVNSDLLTKIDSVDQEPSVRFVDLTSPTIEKLGRTGEPTKLSAPQDFVSVPLMKN